VDEFDYFMIRLRRPGPESAVIELVGTVEHIGTGRKLVFSCSTELLGFLSPISAPGSKMRLQPVVSKDG
jgi:hypothetical protein